MVAANIEDSIEKELIDRLKNGVYGDIYNYNPAVFNKIMRENEIEDEEKVIKSLIIPTFRMNWSNRKRRRRIILIKR